MKARKIVASFAVLALLSACTGGLPPSLRRDIAYEHDRLQDTKRQINDAKLTVSRDLASNPDLFQNTPAAAGWQAKFGDIQHNLSEADAIDHGLAKLNEQGRVHGPDLDRAERELARERTLREVAGADARAVSDKVSTWANFKQDLPGHLDAMRADYDAVHSADLQPVAARIQQAEHDWPAKQSTLESGLVSLREIETSANTLWENTRTAREDAAAGKASGAEIATLISASDELARDRNRMSAQPVELTARAGQLYDSWDKILTDLDDARSGRDRQYREKIKTVRTHLEDVASKKAETSSSEQWVNVSEPAFNAVENDIGMTLEHKDAGLFDDEANKTPQPAGFAYIAPETQPGNQYGYWDHSSGHTIWTWLPEYLILRELLWNHAYRPVAIDEYRSYRTAQRAGQTYYGRETPASPPKYGTHGTFTQTNYAGSRYVQSGGFKGSAYASRNGGSVASRNASPELDQHRSPAWSSGTGGHRFGRSAGPSSGRQFGQSKSFRGLGRSFGRRR